MILVTGAGGMIGSALVERLQGRALRAAYRKTPPPGAAEAVQADLTAPADCRLVAQGCGMAVLAAAESGGAALNQRQPGSHVTQNLLMNVQLAEALVEAGVRRVVFLSSSTVYPDQHAPVREDELDLNREPAQHFFGVGWAFRASEKVLEFWHRQRGIEVAVLRLSNVYGPRARFAAGSSNFIPALIRRAVAGEDPFRVWGAPDVVRDVLYVSDCVDAIVRVLELPELGFEVLNLGSGQPRTVEEVVQTVLAVAGHQPRERGYDAGAPTSSAYRALNIDRIRARLGWNPQVSLEEGLRLTTEWWRAQEAVWAR